MMPIARRERDVSLRPKKGAKTQLETRCPSRDSAQKDVPPAGTRGGSLGFPYVSAALPGFV